MTQKRRMMLVAVIGAFLLPLPQQAGATQASQGAQGLSKPQTLSTRECRQFTTERRAGSGQGDRYGVMCRQPDGSWQRLSSEAGGDDPYAKGGYFIRPEPSSPRFSADIPPSRSHTHYFDGGVGVVISDRPYVIVDPYQSRRPFRGGYGYYGYGRDWSPAKRSFHRHHHGPGWNKHWQQHQKHRGNNRRLGD